VCSTSQLQLLINTETTTLQELVSKVLKGRLGVNEPTITIGSSGVYEEGEGCATELAANLPLLLKDLPCGGITDATNISVEDFSQDLDMNICVYHR
jgi:ubiquitin-like 1-activating enzyme E1 B